MIPRSFPRGITASGCTNASTRSEINASLIAFTCEHASIPSSERHFDDVLGEISDRESSAPNVPSGQQADPGDSRDSASQCNWLAIPARHPLRDSPTRTPTELPHPHLLTSQSWSHRSHRRWNQHRPSELPESGPSIHLRMAQRPAVCSSCEPPGTTICCVGTGQRTAGSQGDGDRNLAIVVVDVANEPVWACGRMVGSGALCQQPRNQHLRTGQGLGVGVWGPGTLNRVRATSREDHSRARVPCSQPDSRSSVVKTLRSTSPTRTSSPTNPSITRIPSLTPGRGREDVSARQCQTWARDESRDATAISVVQQPSDLAPAHRHVSAFLLRTIRSDTRVGD
eukprot:3939970-Rhodomonas_salina.1